MRDVACTEETRNTHKILAGMPEGKYNLVDLSEVEG
jgi:hypothetical protein